MDRRARRVQGLAALVALALPLAAVGSSTGEWGAARGPEGGIIRALAVDPQDPRTIYAGAEGGGIFKSVDGGASWRFSGAGLELGTEVQHVTDLAIDPDSPQVVYAAVGEDEKGALFRSTDGGGSWGRVSGLPVRASVTAVALDGSTPSRVYAGGEGIYMSSDGGTSWSQSALSPFGVEALIVAPSAPSTIYAGTLNGVHRSTNGGGTWSLRGLDGEFVEALAVDPGNANVLYAGTLEILDSAEGVFKSTDGGATWSRINRGLTCDGDRCNVLGLAIDSRDPSTLYAGTLGFGVFKSTDAGRSWGPAADVDGLLGQAVLSLATGSGAPGMVYAGTFDGVHGSADGGATWASSGPVASIVEALALDTRGAGTLYAAGLGVHRSRDNGVTWANIGSDLWAAEVAALALHPKAPSTLYAGTDVGVFRTVDGGRRWRRAGLELNAGVLSIAVDPRSTSTVLAGREDGLFWTTNGGRSWKRSSAARDAKGLAVHPRAPQTVYAATLRGVYRSENFGRTWRRTALPYGAESIAIDPSRGRTLYAGTVVGVFTTTNGGKTWARAGRFADTAVMALAIDPRRPRTIYAAVRGGVFRTVDSGKSWAPFGGQLTNRDVRALAVEPNSGVVYAGTYGGGVFALDPTP